MSDDEITKSSEMTPAQLRMAKARQTKAAKRAAETLTRQAPNPAEPPEQVAAARSQTRTSARSDGRLEVLGRNGEMLSRSQIQVGDSFEIPKDQWPPGWSYQWNTVSVHGSSEIVQDENHRHYLNGWRPVPAERYAGTLLPKGSTGNVIRGQMMLVERPAVLTAQAKAEDEANARQLISDRNEALKLSGVKQQMGQGFEMGGKYRGTGGDIRISVDQGLDIPRPQHTLADPE